MSKLQEMKILFWMTFEFLFCTVFLIADILFFLVTGKNMK